MESGDSLEMKYTGWLVNSDGSLGDVFDSNHNSEKTFRFKSGRGKVIKVLSLFKKSNPVFWLATTFLFFVLKTNLKLIQLSYHSFFKSFFTILKLFTYQN